MSVFHFKYFTVKQSQSSMKVGTDAMLLGAFVEVNFASHALDVGSGTGVISLMIAQRYPGISVTAIEIDEQAESECAENFSESLWNDRLTTVHGDFSTYTSSGSFDLIVSNPPYYSSTMENADERKAQSRHLSALPMDVFFRKSAQLLSDTGTIWIIVPFSDEQNWIDTAFEEELFIQKTIVIQGKPELNPNRVILNFSRKRTEPISQAFIIRKSDGNYTEEYRALTLEFHGKKI